MLFVADSDSIMDEDENNVSAKSHKVRKTGRKAEKKRQKDVKEDADTKQKNPKAFAIQSVNKLARTFHR